MHVHTLHACVQQNQTPNMFPSPVFAVCSVGVGDSQAPRKLLQDRDGLLRLGGLDGGLGGGDDGE